MHPSPSHFKQLAIECKVGTRGRELGEKEFDIKVLLCRSGREQRCCHSLLTCGMEVVPAASAQESQAGDPLGESEEDVGV